MARRPAPIADISQDVFALLDLVRNQDEYRAKVTALQAMIDEHNSLIKSVVGLDSIEEATLRSKLDRDEAVRVLAAAKGEAERLVSGAKKLVADTEDTLATTKASLDARSADIRLAEAQLAQAREQFETRVSSVSNALAEKEQQLALMRASLDRETKEFESKRSKLQAALG